MLKQKPDLPQGTLDMLVLKALSLGPMHGYGVGHRIGQLAEEMLKVELGVEEAKWSHLSMAVGKVLRTV